MDTYIALVHVQYVIAASAVPRGGAAPSLSSSSSARARGEVRARCADDGARTTRVDRGNARAVDDDDASDRVRDGAFDGAQESHRA